MQKMKTNFGHCIMFHDNSEEINKKTSEWGWGDCLRLSIIASLARLYHH